MLKHERNKVFLCIERMRFHKCGLKYILMPWQKMQICRCPPSKIGGSKHNIQISEAFSIRVLSSVRDAFCSSRDHIDQILAG